MEIYLFVEDVSDNETGSKWQDICGANGLVLKIINFGCPLAPYALQNLTAPRLCPRMKKRILHFRLVSLYLRHLQKGNRQHSAGTIMKKTASPTSLDWMPTPQLASPSGIERMP